MNMTRSTMMAASRAMVVIASHLTPEQAADAAGDLRALDGLDRERRFFGDAADLLEKMVRERDSDGFWTHT